ncbi:MAG: DsrE family protein, partial [Candidatus Poseidoniia archaeon]|nr:DsrE family protein [Candidatus Poseidoniia archaeon]
MASKGVLYLLLSGPADTARALELLRLAESQAGLGDHGVAVLLQGDGVEWLAEGASSEAQAALQVISELSGGVFACSHSLAERGVVPAL